MNRIRLSTLFSIGFLLFSQLAFSQTTTLGVSAPLSGVGMGWGNDLRNVLAFANDKLANGKYKFILEDDQCSIKNGITVAEKFAAFDKLKVVFTLCGQVTIASAPRYKASAVTVMATLATPSEISDLGVFRTSLNDALAARL